MAGFTTSLDASVLNHFLKGTPWVQSTHIQVALFTTAPDPKTGAGGVEASGSGYARVTADAWTVAAAVGSNTNAVNFPTPLASWGTLVAFGIYFDSTLAIVANLTNSKITNIGDSISFPAGSLAFTMN
jgi:hypothetical protein